jgi:acyl-ACP thioesterase
MNRPESMTLSWFLTAGETDAEGRMPITLFAARAIEIATKHANALGIGYSALIQHRLGWVLARLSIEIYRYPEINDTYSITTWIEGYNRYFSDRCYEMTDANGNVIAAIRSVWVAIDVDKRTMADLNELERDSFPIVNRKCPVSKIRSLAVDANAPSRTAEYTFNYCDLDFNRHVNTLRYIVLALNQFPLEWHDSHAVQRFDIVFDHESLYGDTVQVVTGQLARSDGSAYAIDINSPRGGRSVGVAIKFTE